MSLSSLQAQLAALHQKGTAVVATAAADCDDDEGGARHHHPGSTHATSLRHEDAVGRGLRYSVRDGFASADDNNGKGAKFQPSLIYGTAREAANVPVGALRDRADDALQNLKRLYGYGREEEEDDEDDDDDAVKMAEEDAESDDDDNNANDNDDIADDPLLELVRIESFERFSPKRGQISRMLLCATVLLHDDDDSDAYGDCLCILEYLLRRYRLHAESPLELLWTALPHFRRHPGLFQRVLHLVDLTAVDQGGQSYLWLRPYCDAGNGNNNSAIIPPLSLMGQKTAQHPSTWLRRLVRSTQRIASAAAAATESRRRRRRTRQQQRQLPPLARSFQRGAQQYLSWSAALIVRGLAWLEQQQEPEIATGGTDRREAVVRTLLPGILSSLSSVKNAIAVASSEYDDEQDSWTGYDWLAWGSVVAAAVSETMELAPATVELVTGKLLRGLVAAANRRSRGRPRRTRQAADVRADAIETVLSILMPPRKQFEVDQDTYLPLLNEKWLGCRLPDETLNSLLLLRDNSQSDSSSSLSAVLGYVYEVRRVVVAPLLATIFVRGTRRLRLDTSEGQLEGMAEIIIKHFRSLVLEPSLQSLWKDPRIDLVASLASWIVSSALNPVKEIEEHRQHQMEQVQRQCQVYREVLESLHERDGLSCERGIAHAVQQHGVNLSDEVVKAQLVDLLREIVPDADSIFDGGGDQASAASSSLILPPRVALEHADAAVRLQAIRRLVSLSCNGEEGDDGASGGSGGHSLAESLLRRWSADDDVSVALAASDALSENNGAILDRLSVDDENGPRIAETVLSGLYRWTESKALQTSSPKLQQLLENNLFLAGRVALELEPLGGSTSTSILRQLLMEFIVAHLESNTEVLVAQAARAVLVALNKDVSSIKNGELLSLANACLLGDDHFLTSIEESYSRTEGNINSEREKSLRQRCIWLILSKLSSGEGHGDKPAAPRRFLSLCMTFLRHGRLANKIDDARLEILRNALRSVISLEENDSADLVLSLSGVPSQWMYEQVIQPTILSLTKSGHEDGKSSASSVAVLLEAAARESTSDVSIERLIILAVETVSLEDETCQFTAIIPSLALLVHPIAGVRSAALVLLQKIGDRLPSRGEWSSLTKFFAKIVEMKNSATLGTMDLHNVLSLALKGSDSSFDVARKLLRLCVLSAGMPVDGDSALDPNLSTYQIGVDKAIGGCRSASMVLDAMELAGEDIFPLELRWSEAGRFILEGVLEIASCPHLAPLAEVTVKMLKGVKVSDPRIIISSGPRASGGRSRSYSVGNLEGVTIVHPYPKDMLDAVLRILSKCMEGQSSQLLASFLFSDLLASKSWGDLVFAKLPGERRRAISLAILSCICNGTNDESERTFSLLPLQPADVVALLKKSENDISSVSILCDFVRLNSSRLRSSTGTSDIVIALFNILASLGTNSDNDELEFMRQSILVAISTLWKSTDSSDSSRIKIDKKKLSLCSSALLGVLGGTSHSSGSLGTFRSRTAALSLLSDLCADCPENIIGSLVSVMQSSIASSDDGIALSRDARPTLSVVVPLYLKYGPSCGARQIHLLASFVDATIKAPASTVFPLYQDFTRVLIASAGDEQSAGLSVAAFLACFLARSCSDTSDEALAKPSNFISHILDEVPPSTQLSCLHCLLYFGKSLVFYSIDFEESPDDRAASIAESDGFKLLPTPIELAELAAASSESQRTPSKFSAPEKERMYTFATAILQAFGDVLHLEGVRSCINEAQGDISVQSLRIWQNLLIADTSVRRALNRNTDVGRAVFLNGASSLCEEFRQIFLGILPLHLFLASASSILRDGTQQVQESVLRILADRAVEADSSSPESRLFIDIVPDISSLLQSTDVADTALLQAAILALEHVAHVAKSADRRDVEKFSDALKQLSLLLQGCGYDLPYDEIDATLRPLICSIALCSVTLVRTVGARAIVCLPALLKPLLSVLSSANVYVETKYDRMKDEEEARVLQLSILRSIAAAVNTIPQSLPPFLPMVLTEKVLLSPSLRSLCNDASKSVSVATEHLERALSSRIPSRILIPAASRAVVACSNKDGLVTLVSLMKSSVGQATSRESVAHQDSILKAIEEICDRDGTFTENTVLIESTSDLLLALVMKLSEVQLRKTYSRLREWRGDLGENPEMLSWKRYAFWSWSGLLSKELGAIFLPCLGSVLSDVKIELELAMSMLSSRISAEKLAKGQKRRRLELTGGNVAYDEASVRCLQPLLLCLDNALRADAREGGSWIRSDDNQRFNLLVDPLGRLLQYRAHIDNEEVIHHETSGGVGGIVNCITSLATAAGNETLWKPLNHVVLEACGSDSRSSARIAGLTCLMSLMRSLGEEYMVLLPECLPVLSELLEDDEDVARLARSCVSLAEELIGENLL